jgi:phosphonate transport system ATP-binding protein
VARPPIPVISVDINTHRHRVATASIAAGAPEACGLSLRLERVSVRYRGTQSRTHAALDDVDLRIGASEHVAVVGPSGAGKTTLLQVAAAALRATVGQVLLDGSEPWALGSRRRRQLRGQVFLAPQVPPLPPRQRVVTAVLAGRLPAMSLASSVQSLFYPLDINAAYEALAPFDLGDRLFDRVDRLSGGERQRVSMARALLSPARLWLLDEPLAALDPVWADRALGILRHQAAQRGVTLFVSLHQVDMALEHFPRLVGLRDGAIHFDSPVSQVSSEQLRALYAHERKAPESSALPPEEAGEPGAVPMAWR